MRDSEDRLDGFLLPDGDAFELVERLDEEPPEVVAPKTICGY